jgi:8-oxo-dGTP pyrophosphatase MutT (NUDIX family)
VLPRRHTAALLLALSPAAAAEELAGPANPDGIEAAGCLISAPGGFVMGVNRLINRLQLPVGRHLDGESAAATAARETREETGIEVSVGQPLLRLNQGRVVLFACVPVDPHTDFRHLDPEDTVEVSRALVVDPATLMTPDGERVTTRWRFPEVRWLLRGLFTGARAGASD